MIEFFDQTLGFLQTIYDWVMQSGKALIFAVATVGEISPLFFYALQLLPTVLGGVMIASLIIYVVRFILLK